MVEDSADDRVRRVVDSFGVAARTLVNAVQLGQMRSIDRAYAQVTTPLIFHCEDDWLFTRGGFIRELRHRASDLRRRQHGGASASPGAEPAR